MMVFGFDFLQLKWFTVIVMNAMQHEMHVSELPNPH